MSLGRGAVSAILIGGIIAGTVDIGAAALINGKGPDFIAQVIAAGLIGKGSFAGGTGTVVLGVITQWVLSIIIAAIYVGASLKLPILRKQWWPAGLAYGIPVFVVMEFVVLRFSALHATPHFTTDSLVKNVIAMMVFGLIIAGVARWRMGAEAAPVSA